MSLQDLQNVLQQQASGPGGAVSICAATLTAAGLTASSGFDATVQGGLVLTGPLAVAVSIAIPAPGASTLTFPGTCGVLGLTGVAVTVTFTLQADNTTCDVLLDFVLNQWTFRDSFPLLQGFPFSLLLLSGTHALLTTAAQTSYLYGITPLTLVHGLNLASVLGLSGMLGILQAIMASLGEGDSVVFAGTLDLTGITSLAQATPQMAIGGTLTASITGNTHFDLSGPALWLESMPSESGGLAYWVSLATTLSIDHKPFSTFKAALLDGTPLLTFTLLPIDNALSFGEIGSLIGGVDLVSEVPAELKSVFDSISLTGLVVSIDTATMSLDMLSVSIGTKSPWHMGDVTLDSFSMNCLVLAPFSSNQDVSVAFSATAEFFPSVFAGLFSFELSYDFTSSMLIIGASYTGLVSISALVSGLSNGAITIPDAINTLQFTDFGATFTKLADAQYKYQLAGTAEATFNVQVAGKPVEANFEINIDSAASTYVLLGGLVVGGSYFAARADLSGSDKVLSASWTALDNDYLELTGILASLGFTPPSIPSDLDLGLAAAGITWHLTADTFLILADSVNYGKAAFAVVSTGTVYEYIFLLGIDKTFSLSNLPLVGQELAKIETVQVSGLEVVIASQPVTQAIAGLVNKLIQAASSTIVYPLLPANGTTGSFVLQAQIAFGSQIVPLNLQLGGSSSPKAASAPGTMEVLPPRATATPSPTGSGVQTSTEGATTWFTVQKSFGPLSIQRIGALFQSDRQTIWFEIDASLTLGPLTLSLMGLGVGSPLKSFDPQFSLQGLGIDYAKPPLIIAGTLVNLAPPGENYIAFEGGVTIGTGDFTLLAFGFYGNQNKFNSMFLFGDIAYDFGGPPAFFVTGLALGFGYNSNLRIPTVDQIVTFPFVQVLPTSMVPESGLFGANPSPQKVLGIVMDTKPAWVSAQQGTLWFGAGITFTSFELVNSQALVLVEIGQDLTIGLIGTSRAQFPQAVAAEIPVYAYIELDLEIIFAPLQGVFSLQAVLASSSFLLDKACVLTGGFAFFVWFGSNAHAGDFVLTLGGYNAGFTPPSYYPAVPRVGFHWSLDSSISISGGAYFAFTPSALMVGGELNATYQAGNLKAWFDAYADMIVQWKPFWFDARIGISIGASYKVNLLFTSFTVTAELGCNLEIWGPPTGGTVGIDWYIISFTIPFGQSKNSTKPVIKQWSDVATMLPGGGASANSILTLSPSSGLTPGPTAPAASGPAEAGAIGLAAAGLAAVAPATSTPTADPAPPAPWIVRGSSFGFSTSSAVPASSATLGTAHAVNGTGFNVAPLGWTGVSASHAVTLTDEKGNDISSAFSVLPALRSLPAQLWGTQTTSTPAADAQLVPGQLTGLSILVNPPAIGGSAGPVDVAVNLSGIDMALHHALLGISCSAQPSGDVPVASSSTIAVLVNPDTGIGSTPAVAARNAILAALTAAGYPPSTANDPMTGFAAQAGSALSAEPLLVS